MLRRGKNNRTDTNKKTAKKISSQCNTEKTRDAMHLTSSLSDISYFMGSVCRLPSEIQTETDSRLTLLLRSIFNENKR